MTQVLEIEGLGLLHFDHTKFTDEEWAALEALEAEAQERMR